MNPSNGFTFGSWNAGSRTGDYTQLIRDRIGATDKSPNFSGLMPSNPDDQAMVDSIGKVRDKLLGETAKDLARAADVYALQEVSGDDRADIKAFKSSGFEIIRPPKKNPLYASETDTAIAINPAKFKNIENRSFNDTASGRDFAVAVAVEKATGRKIAFISGHIAGFDLEAEKQIREEQAADGDGDIANMIATLKNICSDCDSVMIGFDTNAIPEIYKKRFQLLTDAGFQLYRTGSPTSNMSRNSRDETAKLQERELDYIFVKNKKPSGFFNFLRNLFKNKDVYIIKKDVYVTKLIRDNTSLSLDPISSPSDHIPVFVRVEKLQRKTPVNGSPGIFDNLRNRVRKFFQTK
jgi:endonuclease/exonuclease/phosphatase family metal-dependent hydrolase